MTDQEKIICQNCKSEISAEIFRSCYSVCPKCNFHFIIGAEDRLEMLIDDDSFVEHDADLFSINPLEFPGYEEKLIRDRKRTGRNSEIITGTAKIGGFDVAIAIGDVRFMGGSLGAVIGEKLTRIIEFATAEKLPIVFVSASGGMRMQEGTVALLQMEKTAAACVRHAAADLFSISVMTDPTFGGTTASFASLGNVILAEPGARIGFAGPRAVASIREKLPENFQKSEFLLDHGMIDRIVHRSEMRSIIIELLDFAR